MKTIPNFTVRRRCTRCGHEQDVTSAVAVQKDGETISGCFGSAYDHCNKCDGWMEEAPKPLTDEEFAEKMRSMNELLRQKL